MKKFLVLSICALFGIACGPPPSPEPGGGGGGVGTGGSGGGGGVQQGWGAIEVVSTVGGCQVFLDGEDTGQLTPATLMGVKVGNHTVEVKRTDYVSLKKEVSVSEGVTTKTSIVVARDLTGKWLMNNNGWILDVKMVEPPTNKGEIWSLGFQPVNYKVEGNTLIHPQESDGTKANGSVSADGQRIEADFYSPAFSPPNQHYTFTKISS